MPAEDVKAPGMSSLPRRVSVSAITNGVAATITRPMGTFTKSTHRHPSVLVRAPPRSTPMAAPPPDIAA